MISGTWLKILYGIFIAERYVYPTTVWEYVAAGGKSWVEQGADDGANTHKDDDDYDGESVRKRALKNVVKL